MAAAAHRGKRAQGVCVIGPGTRFLSGLTYFTYSLAGALVHVVSDVRVVWLRRLLPTRLYPGRARVGAPISTLRLPAGVPAFDGLDWYWWPSLFLAVRFLVRERPAVLLLEWWTAATLHTYVALAWIASRLGATVVVEFHEVQDPGEAEIRLLSRYVRRFMPFLLARTSGVIAHSQTELDAIRTVYSLAGKSTVVIPHGEYDHYLGGTPLREAPPGVCNFLYFGVIRPFKGVETLVRAFQSFSNDEIGDFWLTIVGETWEGWTLPRDLVENGPHRERITFVNRYVTDVEASDYFAGGDVVVLPYRRSTQSGPLHIAMAHGLPIVASDVGGITEATAKYEGIILVPPDSPERLTAAMRQAASLKGRRFAGSRAWKEIAPRYAHFLREVDSRLKVAPAACGRELIDR
jgi:glycosyltransferase involved in cell wall biosynthesis